MNGETVGRREDETRRRLLRGTEEEKITGGSQ